MDKIRKIEEALEKVKADAKKQGLHLELKYTLTDPEREKLQHKMQSNLLSAQSQIAAAIECAKQLGLDHINFMGGIVKWSHDGMDAAGGPRIWNEWKASDFDCYPTDEQWEWFHGENPPPKPYDGY